MTILTLYLALAGSFDGKQMKYKEVVAAPRLGAQVRCDDATMWEAIARTLDSATTKVNGAMDSFKRPKGFLELVIIFTSGRSRST